MGAVLDNSAILGSDVKQTWDENGQPKESHPYFRPHLKQGWVPDFIPKLAESAVDANLIDQIIPVDGNESLRLTRELAQKEGIFTGISGGATFVAVLEVGRNAEPCSNTVCMLPDTGERYLSTVLFEDFAVDMTEEEIEISRSSPRFRFDPSAPAPAAATKDDELPEAPAHAVQFVEDAIKDTDNPVVFFALEWCEFCWSVRKMFAEYDIPYRAIDLDSVEYQKENLGGDIRIVLRNKISSPTIPQIFVGDHYICGCTETFDAFNGGSLQELLSKNYITCKASGGQNAYTFLPTWLHPR